MNADRAARGLPQKWSIRCAGLVMALSPDPAPLPHKLVAVWLTTLCCSGASTGDKAMPSPSASQARALSPEERAKLAEVLLESLRDTPSAEIEEAWERGIDERTAAYDRGELPTFDAESVFAEARRLAR